MRPDIAQNYRTAIDWDMYGKLILRHENKKVATSMKTSDTEQHTITLLETLSGKQYKRDQKLCLITNSNYTTHHISIAPLKAFNHAISNSIKSNTLIEIEENPFLAIEQPDLVLIPMLQKLGPRIPDIYMAVQQNQGVQTVTL